uniref:DDE Tnp4 domain-containing protein n=1 Tax=Bactrocera latifrons TaxID=174628 RepID=A0A0K8WAV4_BACLA
MKPFPFSVNQPESEKIFNRRISSCRRVVENAFGHLKARFRQIGRGLEVNLKNVNLVIKSCCIIHNICNNRNDTVNMQWIQQANAGNSGRQPHRAHIDRQEIICGIEIRQAIMTHFIHGKYYL